MTIRRIGNLPKPGREGWTMPHRRPCFHPEHNPPQHIVLAPGIYEHECPACGHKTIFTVRETYWRSWHVPGMRASTSYTMTR